MERYMICGQEVHPEVLGQDEFRDMLAQHYVGFRHKTPLCLCRDPGLRLYISKHSDSYVLKRWPGEGANHHFTCEKYEPPLEASGAGALLGSAIKEDIKTGVTDLALGFSLKRVKRTMNTGKDPIPADEAVDESQAPTKSEERKLTLKSLLHYLWDSAKLTYWDAERPRRRNWAYISPLLSDICQTSAAHKKPLSHFLYIPPMWNQEDARKQEHARRTFIGQHVTTAGPRKIMMIIAELKSVESSQFGFKVTLRSMPDTAIFMKQDLWERLRAKYAYQIGRWMTDNGEGANTKNGAASHMVTAMTVSVSPTGACTVEDAAFMTVNREWIPVYSFHEDLLVQTAIDSKRTFIKPLTYNLARGRTLPTVILTDTKPLATNIFLSTPEESEVLALSRQQLIDDGASRGRSVVWDITEALDIDELLTQVTPPASVGTRRQPPPEAATEPLQAE